MLRAAPRLLRARACALFCPVPAPCALCPVEPCAHALCPVPYCALCPRPVHSNALCPRPVHSNALCPRSVHSNALCPRPVPANPCPVVPCALGPLCPGSPHNMWHAACNACSTRAGGQQHGPAPPCCARTFLGQGGAGGQRAQRPWGQLLWLQQILQEGGWGHLRRISSSKS